jgi:hypothetical protein
MAKNRNTFEKSQREHAKRRKAEEKRASKRQKKTDPEPAATRETSEDQERGTAD